MSAQVGRWRTRAGHVEVGMLSPTERAEHLRRDRMERITRLRRR